MPTNPPAPVRRGRRVALLFSGWSDEGHLNEIEYLYRALIAPPYSYGASDISVLNFDGTRNYHLVLTQPVRGKIWPGDGTPYRAPIDGPGSIASLEQVFQTWAGPPAAGGLTSNDSVFLYFTGHGFLPYGANPETWLRCYPDPSYYSASQLAGQIASLPAIRQLMVMAQPCHAGGLVQPILTASTAAATCVAAACSQPLYSLGGIPANPFSPFSKAWISALTGRQPDGVTPLAAPGADTDGDGVISAREAFEFAQAAAVADQPMFAANPPAAESMNLL